MRVAVGQLRVGPDPQVNAAACIELISKASDAGVHLLVLPEAVLARLDADQHLIAGLAQPLDGQFVGSLLEYTMGREITVIFGIHQTGTPARAYNTVLAIRAGQILAEYRKLHLYDAFRYRESDNVLPGDQLPPVFQCHGWRVGIMTCYDVRFPEVARLLAEQGAELIVIPAAWARGPEKERHWELMVAARALENTCFVAAADECSPANIGQSMIVDPLATVLARLGHQPGIAEVDIDQQHLVAARRTLPVLSNRRFRIDRAIVGLGEHQSEQ